MKQEVAVFDLMILGILVFPYWMVDENIISKCRFSGNSLDLTTLPAHPTKLLLVLLVIAGSHAIEVIESRPVVVAVEVNEVLPHELISLLLV